MFGYDFGVFRVIGQVDCFEDIVCHVIEFLASFALVEEAVFVFFASDHAALHFWGLAVDGAALRHIVLHNDKVTPPALGFAFGDIPKAFAWEFFRLFDAGVIEHG
jgi:hypothetical protein